MRKTLFVLIFVFFICHSNGQSKYDIVLNYFIDTIDLYDKVRDAIQQSEYLSEYSNIKIIPIYFFDDYSLHSRQDYLDGTFLRELHPKYYQIRGLFQKHEKKRRENNKPNSWLVAVDEFLLVDNRGGFVAKVESGTFCIYSCIKRTDSTLYLSPKSFLTETINTYGFDFVFRTSKFGHLYKKPTVYFGINKDKKRISVIIHTMYGCKVFPIDDIVNNHWEDFLNQLVRLKNQVNEELKESFENEMSGNKYKLCMPFY